MTSSFQHSHPGHHLHVEMASADENDPLFAWKERRRHPAFNKKRLMAVMAFGVVLVVAAVIMGGSSSPALLEADSMPDSSNPEGQYDWKKCKESNDPDCWKKEGERVGGFWKDFRMKMKGWWANLFGKKDETTATEAPVKETPTEAPKAVEETPTEVPKAAKKHKEPKATEPAVAEEPKS